MKRLRISHKTEYLYNEPVSFGPHRIMMRPREGHDIRILDGRLEVEPEATVRWMRDIYNNSIAILTFAEPSNRLSILGEAEIDYLRDSPIECLIEPYARHFPFQYAPEEQIELIQYRLPSYPYDGARLHGWLEDLYRHGSGKVMETFDLLGLLNTHIYKSFVYANRDEHGTQAPCETLSLGTGSCRDFAVLMMEAARYWGFGARFVTGYIQLSEGQHGATHAWTEVYIPGAGWHGFDPTNNKMVGSEHIPVAVARGQEKACPVSGAWQGPANAFNRMEVSVHTSAM
ncbi:MAG: transglutaminase family protein [Porphyrobacter sp.]|nr:transglutaminase family protein [Porphyrobacter sp.]